MTLTIIYNKKFLCADDPCINSCDRGFTLGHGLFETIFYNKKVFPAIEYHWFRLMKSASIIGIELPFNSNELKNMLSKLIESNHLQSTYTALRVTVSDGIGLRGLLPAKKPSANFLISASKYNMKESEYLTACTVETRKNEYSISSRIKSISYLDNIIARKESDEKGYDEAILFNSRNLVADGSYSNIFIVKKNQIFTPKVSDGALPGVVREIIISEMSQDVQIIEKSISYNELMQADEIFVTNSLIGIKSINKIDNRNLYLFSITNKLRCLFQKKMNYF